MQIKQETFDIITDVIHLYRLNKKITIFLLLKNKNNFYYQKEVITKKAKIKFADGPKKKELFMKTLFTCTPI